MIGTLATKFIIALKGSSQSGHIYHIGCDQVYHAFNYFLASGDVCRLLIAFANSLDPDQDQQNVGLDLILLVLILVLIV